MHYFSFKHYKGRSAQHPEIIVYKSMILWKESCLKCVAMLSGNLYQMGVVRAKKGAQVKVQ
jgi:hypothetical protein